MDSSSDIPPYLTNYPHTTQHVQDAVDINGEHQKSNVLHNIKSFLYRKYAPGSPSYVITQVFPFLELVPIFKQGYGFVDALSDILAGLTVSTLLIPQSLSYATLAALPPQYGLFTALFATFCYLLLGSAARVVSIGPFALSSLMIAASVDSIYPGLRQIEQDTPELGLQLRLTYTMTLSFLQGIILLVMAVFKLGTLIDLYSAPSLAGFLAGAGYAVGATQFGNIFGIKTDQGSFLLTVISLFKNIYKINFLTTFIGFSSMTIIYMTDQYSKRHKMRVPIPSQILLVMFWTLISAIFDFHKRFGVKVVGEIEMGFPTPTPPDISLIFGTDSAGYWSNAVLLAAAGFVVAGSISKTMGDKHKFRVNQNAEMNAIGIAAVLGAFCNAYASSAAYSRTVVVEACRPRTRLWAISALIALIFVIFLCGPLLHSLPHAVLGAVVVSSFLPNYFDYEQGIRICRQSFGEGAVWFATFFSSIFFSIQAGVVMGVVASLTHYVLQHGSLNAVYLQQIPWTQRFAHYRKFNAKPMNDGENNTNSDIGNTNNSTTNTSVIPKSLKPSPFYAFLDNLEEGGGLVKVESREQSVTFAKFNRLFGGKYKKTSKTTRKRGLTSDSGDGDDDNDDILNSPYDSAEVELDGLGGVDPQQQQQHSEQSSQQLQQYDNTDVRMTVLHIADRIDHINVNSLTDYITQYENMVSRYLTRFGMSFEEYNNTIHFESIAKTNDLQSLVFAINNLKQAINVPLDYSREVLFRKTSNNSHNNDNNQDMNGNSHFDGYSSGTSNIGNPFINNITQENDPFATDLGVMQTATPLNSISAQQHYQQYYQQQHVQTLDLIHPFPTPQSIDLTLLSLQQQHQLAIMVQDVVIGEVVPVATLVKWEYVILLDFVMFIDITASRQLHAMLQANPNILVLFTNPSQRMVDKLFKFGFKAPNNFVFDNIPLAIAFGKYMFEIAQHTRMYQNLQPTLNTDEQSQV